MILEGFIVPEIPTDNALPGQVMQIAANKYIYRTKYLTVFRELDPSEDDESDPDDAALREEDVGSSSDSERAKSDKRRPDQQPSSPTQTPASPKRFDRLKSMFQSKKQPDIEKQVSFHTPARRRRSRRARRHAAFPNEQANEPRFTRSGWCENESVHRHSLSLSARHELVSPKTATSFRRSRQSHQSHQSLLISNHRRKTRW